MKTYWLSNTNDPTGLWKHEWDHHGTCLSTLKRDCLPTDDDGTDTGPVYYFDTVVSLFKSLPTYQSLADAGILPSKSKTHTLAELQEAIQSSFGHTVAFDCKRSTVFQVYYYFNLKGSAIDGTFVPIDAPRPGSCPRSGIQYHPKPEHRVQSEKTPTFIFIDHIQWIIRRIWA